MRLRDCKVGMMVKVTEKPFLDGKVGVIDHVAEKEVRVDFGSCHWYFFPRNLEPAPAKEGR